MRDVRDNFMANMWNELGYGQKPAIFTKTETITSVVVLVVMSLLVIIRKNIKSAAVDSLGNSGRVFNSRHFIGLIL